MEIVVKNSCIEVHGYEMGMCPRIENCFKMYDMITHSYHYVGLYYNEETKCLCLPRGIDIWFVEKYIGEKAVVDHKYTPFERIGDVYIKYLLFL